jgi:phage terminase large subunit
MRSIKIRSNVYNEKILSSLTRKEFLHILYGGSSSGKSYGIAQYYLEAILDQDRNILALRKVRNTVKNSLFALFVQIINKHNMNELYNINKTDQTITSITGYKIVCAGLDDPEKIKSITFDKGIVTDIWLEEATEFTEEDYNQLTLRLRGKSRKRKRIRMTFNPINKTHWIYKRFFTQEHENVYIDKFTYNDNDFLENEDKERIEELKDLDSVYYEVYALGNWGVLGNLIFSNWKVQTFDDIENELQPLRYGLDFGFSNPAASIKVHYKANERILYIIDEIYEKGLTNDKLADLLKEKEFNGYIRCDSAEPKSIRELRNHGVKSISVKKGKDSIRHGINWLKQQSIIVHPRCQNIINELGMYKYKTDKDGNVLEEPVDANNHAIDALRYATEDLQTHYKTVGLSASQIGV